MSKELTLEEQLAEERQFTFQLVGRLAEHNLGSGKYGSTSVAELTELVRPLMTDFEHKPVSLTARRKTARQLAEYIHFEHYSLDEIEDLIYKELLKYRVYEGDDAPEYTVLDSVLFALCAFVLSPVLTIKWLVTGKFFPKFMRDFIDFYGW